MSVHICTYRRRTKRQAQHIARDISYKNKAASHKINNRKSEGQVDVNVAGWVYTHTHTHGTTQGQRVQWSHAGGSCLACPSLPTRLQRRIVFHTAACKD